jgi:hypothetical protein
MNDFLDYTLRHPLPQQSPAGNLCGLSSTKKCCGA